MTYTKYSASGNDFVIFHSFIEKDYSSDALKLCNRTEGIGADGLVVLVPSNEADFKWLFYNSDGSYAAMCGNATRAVSHYALNNDLVNSNEMKFLTGAGIIKSSVEKDIVETQLTAPKIIKEEFKQDGFTWYLVDTGVPHLVTIVEDLDLYNHELSSKMRYEHNANVNFAKIENGIIKVRTYERGVESETLACGTGMAACFLRAHNLGLVKDSVFVYPKSGEELTLSLRNGTIYFKGAVKKVFTTTI
ncbi:diaminopimelate epimerase [Arcobacter aquimarinus]|uniref:diaminopimelate epimerase n=1 Tax=Arcobacter aquimarinus TaxID=1315211 RepID=UPI002A150369|nr:diaminopimelate epimerase [Arcobacter sp.]